MTKLIFDVIPNVEYGTSSSSNLICFVRVAFLGKSYVYSKLKNIYVGDANFYCTFRYID